MIVAVGVVGARWSPRSSKPLMGSDELAMVGSTPIHSRLYFSQGTLPHAVVTILG